MLTTANGFAGETRVARRGADTPENPAPHHGLALLERPHFAASLLTKPAIILASSWVVAGFLYHLGLTTNLGNMRENTVLLASSMVAVAALSTVSLRGTRRHRHRKVHRVQRAFDLGELTMISTSLNKASLLLGLLIFAFNGGPPMLRLFLGEPLAHKTLQPSGLVGATVALVFVSMIVRCQIRTLDGGSILRAAVPYVLFPVALGDRGQLVLFAAGIATYLLLSRRLSRSAILLAFPCAVAVIIVAGVIGDHRESSNSLASLETGRGAMIFDQLPSGFLWTYTYLTSPLANLNHNIDTTPVGELRYTGRSVIPRVFRPEVVAGEHTKDSFSLVYYELNVSTGFATYISDFGIVGGLTAGLVVGLVLAIFHRAAMRGDPGYTVAFCYFSGVGWLWIFADLALRPITALVVALSALISKLVLVGEPSRRRDNSERVGEDSPRILG